MKHNKLFSLIGISLTLASCSVSNTNTTNNTNINSNPNPSTSISTIVTPNTSDSKILLAYFSWADNVWEFNPDDLNLTAYTGASLNQPGNGRIVTDFIYEEIGGTIHSIQVSDPYSPVYNDCLSRARTELSNNSRPSLKTAVEDFDSYDYIFLGFPNWWNQLPRAVLTFVDTYNFENKTVIPYCMHGTNGKGRPVSELTSYLPSSANVLDSLGVYRPETLTSKSSVTSWLTDLGFINNETNN